MPTVQQSVLILATVKQTYAFLADIERAAGWLPHVVEAERTSVTRHGEGAELELVVEAGGKRARGTTRCTAAEGPARLVFAATLDVGLSTTTTLVLAAEDKHTLLTATIDYAFTGRGFGRMLGSLFGDRYVRQDMTAALDSIKAQIEAEQAERLAKRRAANVR